MKFETLQNLLRARSAFVRRLQLLFFRVLRKLGLSGLLGLVRGVCSLAAREGAGAAGAVGLPAGDTDDARFIQVAEGHCLVTSGYFEVAILDRQHRLIPELSPDTYAPQDHRALRQMPLRRETRQRLCVLVTPGARANYYHWMVDLMPAFRRLTSAPDPELRQAVVLINHSQRAYQKECLEALNLTVEVVNARTYTLYSAARLYARQLPPAGFSIQDARFMRSLFGVRDSEAPARLYVARGATRRRRIRNESEVITLMRSLGFTICHPAELSVSEQARQFAGARTVIGFHGAGLTNTIFCGHGTRFIELFDGGYVADYYSKIAVQLGLEYHRIVSEPGSNHNSAGIAEDISVDVGALEAKIKCVI